MNYREVGMDGREGGRGVGASASASAAAAMGLARQSSIYSLTLDEFQHTLGGLGKDFGSMNMDEFLKNIWMAEETQAMASAVGFGEVGGGSGLQRQGSLTLPRTISLKTVDEVWRDIAKDTGSGCDNNSNNNGGVGDGQWGNASGNSAYGEMTLEEFLVKAGVVREDGLEGGSGGPDGGGGNVFFGGFPVASSSGSAGLGLGFGGLVQVNGGGGDVKSGIEKAGVNLQVDRLQSDYVEVGSRKRMMDGGIGDAVVNGGGVGYGEGRSSKASAVEGSPVSNGDLSSLSPASRLFNRGQGRKAGSVEKAVERRQKRMIKNRESAARSRARKQAYTMELEAEVAKLKEQNQELMRKQAKILEIQMKQIMESNNKKEPTEKQKLRRTQTGPW